MYISIIIAWVLNTQKKLWNTDVIRLCGEKKKDLGDGAGGID